MNWFSCYLEALAGGIPSECDCPLCVSRRERQRRRTDHEDTQ